MREKKRDRESVRERERDIERTIAAKFGTAL